MVQSITLQTSDDDIVAGDILGRLSFAASSETSGSDALLIGAGVYAESEADFTATSNSTSLVFSTANSESATGKLKITGSGHLLPILDNVYDLGSNFFSFRNLCVASGLFASGSAINPSVTILGDNDTGFFAPVADTLAISTSGVERFRINVAGKLLYNTTSSRSVGPSTHPSIQVEGTTQGAGSLQQVVGSTTASVSPGIFLARHRDSFVAGVATVVSGDSLGLIRWHGADGRDIISQAASIEAFVDSTPGLDNMPGRLTFGTTSTGSNLITERMRITSAGNIGIGTTFPSARLQVEGGNVVFNDAGENYDFRVEGDSDQNLFFVDASNDTVNIGTETSTGNKLLVSTSNARAYSDILNSGNLSVDSSFVRIANTYNTTTESFAGFAMSATRSGSNVSQTAFISAVSTNASTYQPHVVFSARNGLSTYTELMRINHVGNVGIGTSSPTTKLHIAGDTNTEGNLSFYTFTESVVSNGNSGTSKTLDLTNGTVHTCTLTGNCTFTMPATTAGKSFTLFLNTGAGGFSASFTGVRWASSTPPTITTTASKVDILSFISDGTYWYGSYSQNYG